ncbi:LANO_0E06788g1_1 [Lachancea nothofagi CBS 11611]|uniref:DNA polymerase alpha subunit B n=1 Tax=Lachancea nothofagi CBS 11611 TaxID=1266666 RepID=A0A1G4JUD1_9SACH|nr:LANO_0E06788g1_1 [Lachancea nothofagi CBS 11611]
MTQRNEIVAKFGEPADEPKVLAALEDLMKIHSLEAEDLYIKWEQYAYQRSGKATELDLATLDAFKQNIQQQIEKKSSLSGGQSSATSSAVKKAKVLKPNVSSPSLFGFGMPRTPTLKKRRVDLTPTQPNEYQKRDATATDSGTTLFTPTNGVIDNALSSMPSPSLNNPDPGKTVETLNISDIDVADGLDIDGDKTLKPSPFFEAAKFNFRTLRQNLLDAADVLDEQLEMFIRAVQEHYKLSASDIGDPTVQSQSVITVVGRIVPDSPATEGILNTESLALETSRLTGVGRRVQLNLEKVHEVSLFPGQIVAFRGKNANGEYFMVEDTLQIPHLNFPVSTSEELLAFNESMESRPTKMAVLNGPYTSSNCLDFSNLAAFIERINAEIRPHVLIMHGPFLDTTHPLIASGNIPEFPELKIQPRTLDEVFTKVISPVLRQIDARIQVILIPSTLDTVSNHAAYPQNSLSRKHLQLPKNFKCYTNPSTFQLNEVFVGCSNIDAFKDIKEVVKGGNTCSKNRFDRIAEHILTQRRFYPLFPGGIKKKKVIGDDGHERWEHISGADLDVPYLGLTEFVGNILPDLIIIPSELTHFARVVQNVLFVNPGMFMRPSGVRGTYAQISVSPPDLLDGKLTKIEGEDDVYLHNLWKRCRVDIVTA